MAINLGPGYGYQQSEEGLGVDFRQAGKELGEGIVKIAKAESDVQGKISTQQKKLEKTLSDIDRMDTDDQYAYWSNGIQVFGDQRTVLDNQLANKQINRRDYLASINTLNGQADQWMVINQQYSKDYDAYMKYLQDPDNNAGVSTAALGSTVQSFGNLHNTKLVYRNGKFVNVKMKPNAAGTGMVEDTTVPPKSMNDMVKLVNFRNQKWDEQAEIKSIKAVLDKNQVIDARGNIITSVTDLPNFEDLVTAEAQTKFVDPNEIDVAEYWAAQGITVGYKGTAPSTGPNKGTVDGYDILLDFTPGDNKPHVVKAGFNFTYNEIDANGDLVPTTISVTESNLGDFAKDDFARKIAQSYGKTIRKPTQPRGGGQQTASQQTARDRIRYINNFLTSDDPSTMQAGIDSYAEAIGAEDIDYSTKTVNGQEVISEYTIRIPGQNPKTVKLYDSTGAKRPSKDVISTFYEISKPNNFPAFTSEWNASGVSNLSGDQYNTGFSDYFTADAGDKDSAVEISTSNARFGRGVQGGSSSQPANLAQVLEFSDQSGQYDREGNLKTFYTEHFKGPMAYGSNPKYRVPKNISSNNKITQDSNGDLTISIKDKTRFRHSDANKGVKIKIPANLTNEEHQVVLEAVTEAMWDNTLRSNGALLTKIDDLIDAALPNNNISINQ